MGTEIGKRVEWLRRRSGISQHELSERMGILRSTLSKIENNERKLTVDELSALARIFNLSMDQIVDQSLEPDVEVLGNTAKGKHKSKPKIRVSVPQQNAEKFKQVLLYVLSKVGSRPNVGETVLYKLLYFIDFDYYELYEEQLMGACYIKNHHGPTPIQFKKIVDQMIDAGEIEKIKSKYYKFEQRKYLPIKDPDLSVLTGRELALIDQVLERLSSKNAADISQYSHNDVPWLVAHDNEPIDYESVFYRTPEFSRRTYE
ncbi:MAG: DUF4065 domain-containing protein [Holophagae bacterium]|nr:DUF4065 domain-containing protein [Holophagae bacterium]